MINSKKLIDEMHEGNIDLHCVEVSITQKFEGGINLKGYGAMKVNQVGTIYLDFICREVSEIPIQSFNSAFPEDPFNSNQKLYLEAVTLEGDLIYAEEFSLKISVFNVSFHTNFHPYAQFGGQISLNVLLQVLCCHLFCLKVTGSVVIL